MSDDARKIDAGRRQMLMAAPPCNRRRRNSRRRWAANPTSW